jgi:uncharacterized membrane protein
MRSSNELGLIATKHGVDFSQVVPLSQATRLAELEQSLGRTDVPFPISTDAARDYLLAAKSRIPFSVGSLSGQSVELGQYQNSQRYDEYSLEEHLSWACLIVLAATGMFQMSANPNYQGFLAFDNSWAIAILAKHLVFLVMIGVSAFLTWGVIPRLQRAALLASRGQEAPEAQRWQRQEKQLLRLNLVLGVLVLALTALARVS